MQSRRWMTLTIGALLGALTLSGCGGTGICTFSATESVTAYRMPSETSDVFGALNAGDAFEAQARTAHGWVGFDPGIAQAGNIGLARWRWVKDPLTFSPSCFEDVEAVTLEQVQADIDASGAG